MKEAIYNAIDRYTDEAIEKLNSLYDEIEMKNEELIALNEQLEWVASTDTFTADQTEKTIVDNADCALYHSKNHGRNRVTHAWELSQKNQPELLG